MNIKVPFMTTEAIEKDAASLLAEYAKARGILIAPPIPIEDIIEKHLKLRIDFDDMHSACGVPLPVTGADILGAMIFDEKRIVIDQSLDPEEQPAMEGRYRFTLAHEGGGHWRLHRRYFNANPGQASLFAEPNPPSVICRSSQAKEPIEWQADFYASCLLMPPDLIFATWNEMFRDQKPRVIQPSFNISHPFVEICRMSFVHKNKPLLIESVANAMERFAQPLAEKFLVSPIAMRIRLEKLGLLLREVPHQHLFASV